MQLAAARRSLLATAGWLFPVAAFTAPSSLKTFFVKLRDSPAHVDLCCACISLKVPHLLGCLITSSKTRHAKTCLQCKRGPGCRMYRLLCTHPWCNAAQHIGPPSYLHTEDV